jgi:rhodanese-related sulfurtransferase
MSLVSQSLLMCAVTLALGLGLLGVRGLPTVALPPGSAATCSAPAPGSAEPVFIALEAAHASFGDPDVLFIDCRTGSEFESGHIAGALSLPSDREHISEAWLALLRGARTVITYCDAQSGCASSVRLAERLQHLGVSDTRILTGGLPEWLAHAYPAESGPCSACPAQSDP